MSSCYGFDQNGNPVYDQITTDDGKKINEAPSYINHDRADCLAQLVDGAQKKGLVIAALTDEITKLMKFEKEQNTQCYRAGLIEAGWIIPSELGKCKLTEAGKYFLKTIYLNPKIRSRLKQ